MHLYAASLDVVSLVWRLRVFSTIFAGARCLESRPEEEKEESEQKPEPVRHRDLVVVFVRAFDHGLDQGRATYCVHF